MQVQGVRGQGVMCRARSTGEGLVMTGHQIGVSQGARSAGSGKALEPRVVAAGNAMGDSVSQVIAGGDIFR